MDYIYLDTDERRRFAQVSHEYLIEQLQFTGKESVNSACNKIKLGFNHPCKELVWVAQPHRYTSRDCMKKAGVAGQQWFNFTDQVDKTFFTGTPSGPLGGGMGGANAARMWNAAALPIFGTSELGGGLNPDGNDEKAFTDATGNPLNPHSDTFPLFDEGKNCFQRVKLQLNGHDRFSERLGSYFNLVQPYQHHTNVPATGINVYSFALKPEEHQPSGTCNMSRIDNATLQVALTPESVNAKCDDTGSSSPQTVDIYVYATNYNVLRIMSGMGGLAYSN